MIRESAIRNHGLGAGDDRATFATRFLGATGEYALAMFGAMFLAFLWMAKDVMLAPISSITVEVIGDVLVLSFVTRRVWGYKHILVPVLQALGFVSAADFVRKNEIEADKVAGRSRTS